MRKGFLYLILFLYCSLASYGQYNATDTLFSINNQTYSSAPFIELYNSNKLRDQNNQPLNLSDALDLYIDFHLKATEAKQLKLDTLPEVIQEIESYSNLAYNNYLYPVNISQELLEETFERLQYFIKVRHILVKIEGRETPKDTLEAYHEASEIYDQLKKGKKFWKLASQYSDDLSVRKNDGEIGYITAFDMDYAFESACYNTPVGHFSKPVRSPYGYHIIQTIEKIKNPGKVRIRHLMLEIKKRNETEKVKTKADSLYHLLNNGADFAELVVKYSDDINSSNEMGILPWFGLFETHPSIEKEAFKLKNIGEFSSVIKTEFGYHIIQLLEKKDYNSLDNCKSEILELLEDDERSRISEEELIEQLKEKYQFKENTQLLSNFYSILDYAYAELWEPLFTLEGNKFSQEKFAEFLSKQESKDIYENFKDYINRLYVNFSNTCILAYHKNKLLDKNPQLKALLYEYRNGVLVYFITKNTIWDKAKSKDNLLEYYKKNINRYGQESIFEEVKNKVSADYRELLEEKWSRELRERYTVTINQPTINKIAN